MRKKIGFKFASATFSTVDGSDFVPKLRLLLQGYESEMRRLGLVDIYDLEQFMLYCSYVSRNIVELGVIDFDDRFSIDEVETCIGNEYVAAGFVDCMRNCVRTAASFLICEGLSFASATCPAR